MAKTATVTLVDPNGDEYVAVAPADINNLVFGAGYRIKEKGLTPDAAIALLIEKGPVAADLAPPSAASTTSTSTNK